MDRHSSEGGVEGGWGPIHSESRLGCNARRWPVVRRGNLTIRPSPDVMVAETVSQMVSGTSAESAVIVIADGRDIKLAYCSAGRAPAANGWSFGPWRGHHRELDTAPIMRLHAVSNSSAGAMIEVTASQCPP